MNYKMILFVAAITCFGIVNASKKTSNVPGSSPQNRVRLDMNDPNAFRQALQLLLQIQQQSVQSQPPSGHFLNLDLGDNIDSIKYTKEDIEKVTVVKNNVNSTQLVFATVTSTEKFENISSNNNQ